ALPIDRLFEVIDGPDPELPVKPCRALRADALELRELRDGAGRLLPCLFESPQPAGPHEFGDVARDVVPDRRDLLEVGAPLDEVLERLRHLVDRPCGVAVRADAERVLALDLEQVGHLVQHVCDLVVLHRSVLARHSRSPRDPARRALRRPRVPPYTFPSARRTRSTNASSSIRRIPSSRARSAFAPGSSPTTT